MFVLLIIMILGIVILCAYTLRVLKKLRTIKKLNAELHDRYALLWADYTRRGQRIALYEAGMTKAAVDELDRQVLSRIEKFAKTAETSV